MKKVGIVHPDLMAKGGAENVCMHMIEALQDQHNIELITFNIPSIPELNGYFDVDVDPKKVEFRRAGIAGPNIHRFSNTRLHVLKKSLLNRFVKNIQYEYDLVISSYNEFDLDSKNIQYINHPDFDRRFRDDNRDQTKIYKFYDELCSSISGFDGLKNGKYFVNSDWMGEIVENLYDIHTKTIYPPVKVNELPHIDWENKERGFVSIGRITPRKNILRNIDIIREIHKYNSDFHIHIIGSAYEPNYYQKVQEIASQSDFIYLEDEVSREELIELVASHRYGIHGKEYEHFGIAVAEIVAAGGIPFVPNSGGQREIVGFIPELMYGTVNDAVTKIEKVVNNRALQQDIQNRLPSASERFGSERFKNTLQDEVKRYLH